MNTVLSIKSALLALVLAASPAFAGPAAVPLEAPSLAVPVAGDCNVIAQQMAAQYGGKGRGTVQNRGGQQVCVVVIVVQGQNGQRAQRIEEVVPLN